MHDKTAPDVVLRESNRLHWLDKKAEGEYGEAQFVSDLTGREQKFEVKSDSWARRSGNVFIEFEQNPFGTGWVASNVMTSTADFYVIQVWNKNKRTLERRLYEVPMLRRAVAKLAKNPANVKMKRRDDGCPGHCVCVSFFTLVRTLDEVAELEDEPPSEVPCPSELSDADNARRAERRRARPK